jgi:hypothetical protein
MSSINDLTVEQLKAELKKKGCRGYSKNNKAELVKLLRKCNTARRIHKTLLEKSRTTHVKKKSSPPAKKKSSPGKNPSALAAGAAGKNPSARALSAGAGDYGSTYPRDGAAGKKPSPYPGDVFDNSYLMTEISNYLPVNELGNTLQTHKQMRQNISNIDKRRRLKALMGEWKQKKEPSQEERLRLRRMGMTWPNPDNPDYIILRTCRKCGKEMGNEIYSYDVPEILHQNFLDRVATKPIFLCRKCEREIAYKTKYKAKKK